MKRTAIVTALVLSLASVAYAQFNDAWLNFTDTELPMSPCGEFNTHSVSLSDRVEGARILYMCWDGRMFVREFVVIPQPEPAVFPPGYGGIMPYGNDGMWAPKQPW